MKFTKEVDFFKANDIEVLLIPRVIHKIVVDHRWVRVGDVVTGTGKDSESESVCGPVWGQIAIWLTMCAKGCEELRILVRWHGRLKFSFLVPWKHWNLPTLPGCSQWMTSGIPSHLSGVHWLWWWEASISTFMIDLYLACYEQLWSILQKGSNFEFLQKCNDFLRAFNFYSCNALAVLNSFAQSSTFNSENWWGFPILSRAISILVVGQGQYGGSSEGSDGEIETCEENAPVACCELVAWNSNPKIYSWG